MLFGTKATLIFSGVFLYKGKVLLIKKCIVNNLSISSARLWNYPIHVHVMYLITIDYY